jgi:hypothetical protein
VSRGPAVWATTLALALVNVGLATVIVASMGQRGFAPFWVGPVLLVAGLAAAVGAVLLWRDYLASLRQR